MSETLNLIEFIKTIKFNGKFIEKVGNIFKFCKGDLNRFALVVRKKLTAMNIWITDKSLMSLSKTMVIIL